MEILVKDPFSEMDFKDFGGDSDDSFSSDENNDIPHHDDEDSGIETEADDEVSEMSFREEEGY